MSRLIRGPREGWLTLLLLLLVVLSPARSLAEAGWVEDLGIVPWLAFFSLLLGVVLAKLPVRGVVAHLFAAEIGTGLVGFYFASMAPRGDWEARFLWLWARISAWLEAAFGGGMSNDAMLFSVLMALTVWLLGYLAAWSAFRWHVIWPTLLACGSALLVNLSYGPPNGLSHFLTFLLPSMLLLTRMTLFQKERDWHRVDADYNRKLSWNSLWGSAALSAGIIAFAWVMPTGTVNAAVAEQWFRVTEPWQGLQSEFDRVFASVGASGSKIEGNRFAKTFALKGAIELGPAQVMVVASLRPEYWAAQSYDRYTGQGWMSSADQTTRLDANDARLTETSRYKGRLDIEQRFKMTGGRSGNVFAASAPVKLSLPVYEDHFGSLEEMAALRAIVPLRVGQQYAVVSSVSVASAAELRKAGTDYPEWIGRYLELPGMRAANPRTPVPTRTPNPSTANPRAADPRTFDPRAGDSRMRLSPLARVYAMAQRVTRGTDNSYDAALALEHYLRGFKYEIKLSTPPPDQDAVDWFLFTSKEGYCDYFASAMAVMARGLGIPARVVSGYNTGTLNELTGLYEVRQENAHTWPELFFPEYGWVRFEPTPSQPEPERLEAPATDPSAENSTGESDLSALSLDTTGRDKMLLGDELDLMGASTGAWSPSDLQDRMIEWTRLTVPGVLLLVVMGLWAFWRRLRSRLTISGRTYLELYWIAGLLGWRMRPSHTPGEYARVLSHASPEFQPEVETVVRSYVEEAYGGRRPASEAAVEESWQRIRLKLPLHLLRRRLGRS